MTAPGRTLLVLMLTLGASASAQELTLPRDSEDGFRRFIHMAQSGRLGTDVSNANVAIRGDVRLELVRSNAAPKVLILTPKHSAQHISRYFEVALGDNATDNDAAVVGAVLDECFLDDPYQFAGLEESLSRDPGPTFAEAWAYGGWQAVAWVIERRMMSLASRRYTIGIILGLACGTIASLALLWGSLPSDAIERRE